MPKNNNAAKEIIETLNWRYATKEFDPTRKVSDSDLETLLESLRLAPSSFGLQPWKFIVVSDKEIKKRLVAACWGQKQLERASHVIVTCVPKTLADSHVSAYMASIDSVNPVTGMVEKTAQKARLAGFKKVIEGYLASLSKERKSEWYKEQTYIAQGFLLFACAQMRIDACPMEGYLKSEVEKILGLEKLGLELVTIVPIGYRSATDKHASEKKVRFAKKDVFIEMK